MTTSKIGFLGIFAAVAAASLLIGNAAYRGHDNDRDVNALLAFQPALKGTAADACVTCHRTGNAPDPDRSGSSRRENHCDYCHAVYVRGKGDIKQTLNRFGLDYLSAGRNVEAVRLLAGKDSDSDGASNESELMKGTNPGDPESQPILPIAPHRVLSASAIGKLATAVSQVMFLNVTHNPAGDSYNSYRGYCLYDLLQAVGISDKAESVDFISLDGYERTHTIDELKRSWPQGVPVLGLGKKDLGDCGWTAYNVSGLDGTKPLPDARILLGFEENGTKIAPARMDPKTGRIVGSGPLRLLVPQAHISPPDMSSAATKACLDKVAPEYRFNENYDHNGGKSSFSIIAIRINPLPKGTRDFEWAKLAQEHIAREEIVFFGALKSSASK
jgi:hypothetical protein